jgi:hypothetical protein
MDMQWLKGKSLSKKLMRKPNPVSPIKAQIAYYSR